MGLCAQVRFLQACLGSHRLWGQLPGLQMVLTGRWRPPWELFLPFRGPGPRKDGFSHRGSQWCLLFLSSSAAAYSLGSRCGIPSRPWPSVRTHTAVDIPNPGGLKAFRNRPVPGKATSQDSRPPTCGRLLLACARLSSVFLVWLSVVSSLHPTVPHQVLIEPLGAPLAVGRAAPAQARC